jgi:hypothetical protein
MTLQHAFERFGLKLEPATAPVEALVVDLSKGCLRIEVG